MTIPGLMLDNISLQKESVEYSVHLYSTDQIPVSEAVKATANTESSMNNGIRGKRGEWQMHSGGNFL